MVVLGGLKFLISEVPLKTFDQKVEVGGEEQLLYRNVQRFRGGLESKAHGLLYRSNLGSGEIKKKKRHGNWRMVGVHGC
jgi:hypothetical protein